ncbi:MAG: hypothetical protein ABSG93_14505 [Solirubrobacteraceae bacterium]
MKYRIIQTYVAQVRQQCQFIIMAHTDIRAASAKGAEAFTERKHGDLETGLRMGEDADRELWYAVQAFATSVANVDKTLWLNRGGSEAAREPVRNVLGVDQDSVSMEQVRKIRNHLDHYDAKINEWAKSSEGLKIEGVGAPLSVSGHTDKAQWRGYDPATDTLSFWDKSAELGPIEVEARRLIRLAEDIASRCPGCMDEGTEHPVTFPVRRGFPAEDDQQESPAVDDST